ncbi:MAG: hypothetical protein AVDCRST_MAG93-4309, partial [uncultured Chloroflexia bacterium]
QVRGDLEQLRRLRHDAAAWGHGLPLPRASRRGKPYI